MNTIGILFKLIANLIFFPFLVGMWTWNVIESLITGKDLDEMYWPEFL